MLAGAQQPWGSTLHIGEVRQHNVAHPGYDMPDVRAQCMLCAFACLAELTALRICMLGARIACWMGRIACEEGRTTQPSGLGLKACNNCHQQQNKNKYMLCSNSTTTHNCTNWTNTACRQWHGGRLLLLLLCNGCALFYTHTPVNTTLS